MTKGNASRKGFEFTASLNQSFAEWTIQSELLTVQFSYQRGSGKLTKMVAIFLALIAVLAELILAGPSNLLHTLNTLWLLLQRM